jgi:hypothetical protein
MGEKEKALKQFITSGHPMLRFGNQFARRGGGETTTLSQNFVSGFRSTTTMRRYDAAASLRKLFLH